LASGNLSSTELNDPLPGRLGQSVEATMERLSVSIRYREDLQNRLQHQAVAIKFKPMLTGGF
jgi:hypothetical protein